MPHAVRFSLRCAVCLPLGLLLASSASAQTSHTGSEGIQAQETLISSNAGLSINVVTGANRFATAGYQGSRAVVTSIDAGHIWNGHETLTQVTTFLDASQGNPANTSKNTSTTGLGSYDFHATWVGHTVGGRNNPGGSNLSGLAAVYKPGLAPGATLWSGAIADVWNNQLSFESSTASFVNPYYRALITGVGGRTTDVVTSSFGYEDPTGTTFETAAIDGMARQSRRTVIFSAGNSGAGVNRIGGAASGTNTIAVGSVGNDTANPAYSSVSGFSSRGPQDYRTPGSRVTVSGTNDPAPGSVVVGARARVDILAPGENLSLAQYNGATGGRSGGPNDLSANRYNGNVAGTSFAAPTVAGGAALLVDAARDRYTGATLDNALDGEVIKAVLLNSADKLTGWTNGQTVVGGAVQTTQALDFNQGAGRMNLNQAFDQYLGGVQDVSGLGGGMITARGWDYGVVGQRLFNEYTFAQPLLAGSQFTATLNWFVNTRYGGTETVTDTTAVFFDSFTNLYLELYRLDGALGTLVARSDATYLNTEHFSFAIGTTGLYQMRVGWGGELYDNLASGANPNGATQQTYGLAWFGTSGAAEAPEPGSIAFLFAGLGVVARAYLRRRRA